MIAQSFFESNKLKKPLMKTMLRIREYSHEKFPQKVDIMS